MAKPPKNAAKTDAAENPKPDLVAELTLQRQQRVERARVDIVKILQKERVDLVVGGFDITGDGRLRGRVNIIAVDNVQ